MNSGAGRMGNNSGMMNHPEPRDEKEVEKNRLKRLNDLVNKLKTDLSLDDLQLYAVRKQIEENDKSIFAVLNKKEIEQEEKMKEIEAISERNDNIILSYLNSEQKEKYKKHIQERKERIEKNRPTR
jgi:uncharacterized membrane protein